MTFLFLLEILGYGGHISFHDDDLTFASVDEGNRYAKIRIGNPPQEIEMDLNMLVSDFYVLTTSSRIGSRYDEFFSKSHGESLYFKYENL